MSVAVPSGRWYEAARVWRTGVVGSARRSLAQESELCGHSEVVALGPVLSDLAVLDAIDVNRVDFESLAGRRLADELTAMEPNSASTRITALGGLHDGVSPERATVLIALSTTHEAWRELVDAHASLGGCRDLADRGVRRRRGAPSMTLRGAAVEATSEVAGLGPVCVRGR